MILIRLLTWRHDESPVARTNYRDPKDVRAIEKYISELKNWHNQINIKFLISKWKIEKYN